MRAALSFLLGILATTSIAIAAPEIILGCQGEGCECFHEYREAKTDKDIPTVRPFTLHKDRSVTSQVLGKFQAGIKAKPLKQELVVDAKGEYVVEAVYGSALPLKKGDKIDTILNEGEGVLRGRHNGKWINFDYENPKLKIVKKTEISEWLSVRVNGLAGFTREQPFQMCLE